MLQLQLPLPLQLPLQWQLQLQQPQSFNIFLQSFPGTSRDAVIYHKMSVYVNFIAHKINEEKCSTRPLAPINRLPSAAEGVAAI